MTQRTRRISHSEDALIKKRLLDCMPSSRYEIDTLTRLADIKTTRSLPTAAVECTRRPRLLINPDFVRENCERDEHLFLLIMHELHHVLLAHTRMYPRMTPAHNVAFDAIINAGLMREFRKPEYRGFFEKLYKADKFPECLLRPPEGWPNNPTYPDADIGPKGTVEIIKRLYPPPMYRPPQTPLYEEVLSLLLKDGSFKMPLLLGNHGSDDMVNDPFMKEAMKQITEKWPDMQIGRRGNGGMMGRRRYGISPAGEDMRRAFSHLLRLAIMPRQGKQRRKARMPVRSEGGTGVLPNPYDRLIPARRRLGGVDTLYNQPGTSKARVPEKPARANVYLDVSGSMNFVINYLLDLLLPYVAKDQAEVFQFSTSVAALTFRDLREGQIQTTGGTNINCVLEHALAVDPPIRKVILLTDGEVGAPLPHLAQGMIDKDIRMHVVLAHGCHLHQACEPISASVLTLPPVY